MQCRFSHVADEMLNQQNPRTPLCGWRGVWRMKTVTVFSAAKGARSSLTKALVPLSKALALVAAKCKGVYSRLIDFCIIQL